jgi:hypothetical protein
MHKMQIRRQISRIGAPVTAAKQENTIFPKSYFQIEIKLLCCESLMRVLMGGGGGFKIQGLSITAQG